MIFRTAVLLIAASVLVVTGCAQRAWEGTTHSTGGYQSPKAAKHAKAPPEENDSDEPKYDLLR